VNKKRDRGHIHQTRAALEMQNLQGAPLLSNAFLHEMEVNIVRYTREFDEGYAFQVFVEHIQDGLNVCWRDFDECDGFKLKKQENDLTS